MKTNEQILSENCTPELAFYIQSIRNIDEFCTQVRNHIDFKANPSIVIKKIENVQWKHSKEKSVIVIPKTEGTLNKFASTQ